MQHIIETVPNSLAKFCSELMPVLYLAIAWNILNGICFFSSQLLFISCFWHYVLLHCEECMNAVIIHLISRVTGQHLFFNSKDFLFCLIKLYLL